jgi:alpha-D-ribose 1-methylphosphonate 5-triphosphate diphosphatase
MLVDGELAIGDGLIREDGDPVCGDSCRFDAAGCLVLPGIIDLHGDAFERVITPRPGVSFDAGLALREADRQLIANGITTAYHGLTVSWEPGERSIECGRRIRAALGEVRPHLRCDTHLHIRWETFALDVADEVAGWLVDEPRAILAFNDHTTPTVGGNRKRGKVETMAERAGMTLDDFKALISRIWTRRDDVPAAIERMAAAARAAGAILLAHDERTVAERQWFRGLGAVASEFPVTLETAAEARDHGEHVILGAPNVLRGGSHTGALTASDAIADGLCTVLATDYYYPAPLNAAFKLVRDGVCDLPAAWALVSANPAEAAGFVDRGQLLPGRRADVVIIDDRDPVAPRLAGVFVAGEMVQADLATGCAIG